MLCYTLLECLLFVCFMGFGNGEVSVTNIKVMYARYNSPRRNCSIHAAADAKIGQIPCVESSEVINF